MSNIPEICWIVNMRNEWAAKRGKLRSRMNYYGNLCNPSPMQKIRYTSLRKKFLKVNAEKAKLTRYTLRLRRLLKKEKGWLVSDSSAGYESVNFLKQDADGRIRPYTMGKRDIVDMAVIFETDRALEKILRSSRSTKYRKV